MGHKFYHAQESTSVSLKGALQHYTSVQVELLIFAILLHFSKCCTTYKNDTRCPFLDNGQIVDRFAELIKPVPDSGMIRLHNQVAGVLTAPFWAGLFSLHFFTSDPNDSK